MTPSQHELFRKYMQCKKTRNHTERTWNGQLHVGLVSVSAEETLVALCSWYFTFLNYFVSVVLLITKKTEEFETSLEQLLASGWLNFVQLFSICQHTYTSTFGGPSCLCDNFYLEAALCGAADYNSS